MTTIFVVTGSREPTSVVRELVPLSLDRQHQATPADELWHGDCRGVDTLCKKWAEARGVETVPFAADWDAHGTAAGPIRNQAMVEAALARAMESSDAC